MSSQQQLLELISVLNSNKKKERLSALESLRGLLKQDGVVKTLHRNSKTQDNTVNWDVIFIRVHNAALTIVDENSSKSRQTNHKQIELIVDVIPEVLRKSLYHKYLLINCNLIVSSVLAVFESDNRIKYLGSTYLSIFSKYIISHRKNWCTLKEENWIGIKNLCKHHYNNPHGIQGTFLLEMLIDIVRFSSKNCQTSHNFLDLFTFLKDIYTSHKNSSSNFEITLIRLTNTLCLQLAVEFRYKVCEFMESVFDSVTNFYEFKKPEKNILVYHFLMATINIHNPNGLWEDKTCWAGDLRKWKNQIKEIFCLCQNEVKMILRNPNDFEIDTDFLNLFVDVSYLVWVSGLANFPESCEPEILFDEPGPSYKRKCIVSVNRSGAKQKKLEDTVMNLLGYINDSVGCWFWLQFFELLLHKYPLSLKDKYCDYIEVLYYIIFDKKNIGNTTIAIRCLTSLLERENLFSKELIVKNESLNDTWKKISKELVRSLWSGTSPETHILIRSLISHSKFQDINPLLRLYHNGALQPSFESFKTLCTISQHCILPEVLNSEKGLNSENSESSENRQGNCEKVKSQMLMWLFQDNVTFPCKDFAKLLMAFILKRFEEDIETLPPKDDILIPQVNINDFCKLITRSYLTVAFKDIKFVTEEKPIENTLRIRIENSMKYKLFELLISQYEKRIVVLEKATLDADQIKGLEECLWFVELICHLLSLFEGSNNLSEDNDFLTRLLQASLFLCSNKCIKLVKRELDLNLFSKLYSTSFHPHVQMKIREPDCIDLDFLQTVFEFFKNGIFESEDATAASEEDNLISDSRFSLLIKNPKSILHYQNLTRREKLITNAAEMMCQYIVTPDCSKCNQYQTILAKKIMRVLTSDDFLNINSNFRVQLVLRVVFNFTKHAGITISEISECLNLLQALCSNKYADFEVIIMVIRVLKDFVSSVTHFADASLQAKFKKIIQGVRSLVVVKKNCGVKTASKYVECLAEIAKVDLDGNWKLEKTDCSIFEDIIDLLKHPYHEVRLTTALNVGLLFIQNSSSERKESTVTWQRKIFKKLFQVLSCNSIGPFKKEKGSVLEYYDYVVASTSLISWAGVICMSTYWRKKALFYLIYTSFLQKFKPRDVQDILTVICEELKFQCVTTYISFNFFYLCFKWTKKGLAIQDFPYYLLGYKTVNDFISNRFRDITVILAETGQFDAITRISADLNESVSTVLKSCHPRLLAFILPSLSENAKCGKIKKAQRLKRLIDQEIGSKASLQLLTSSLDKVIHAMIRNMHDEAYLLSLCDFSGNFNDDKSLGYDAPQIEETLENLGSDEGKPLLEKIAMDMPWIIEKTLRRLLKGVLNGMLLQDRVFAFYKYIFFVELIAKATYKRLIYCKINAFVIRDVVYSLASIIRKYEDEIVVTLACACYRKLGYYFLKEFSSILGEFLPEITTALVPAVRGGHKKALEVLNFFICENHTKLQAHVALLDFFSPDNVFVEINKQICETKHHEKNLDSTVRRFINCGKNKNSLCRVDALKHLLRMLSTEKLELKEMYERLKSSRGFSEDCQNSLLHQLICMLVELTLNDNIEVRTEAARCLGELGPAELTTLVLRPENDFTASKSSSPAIYRLLKSVVNSCSTLLISDKYQIKKAASTVLYAILSTVQGRELFEKDSKTIEYLTPFFSKPGGRLELNVNKEKFFIKIGDSQLWRPITHEIWIINLLEGLLQSLKGSLNVIETFSKLIRVHWQFAESLFPFILDFIVSLDEKNVNETIYKNISSFFEEYFHHKNKAQIIVDKTSVRCILKFVDYTRMQRNLDGLHQGFGSSINYLHVAKAALYCSAYFTSIFYAELWFEDKRTTDHFNLDINTICELYPKEGFALAEILRECHFKIGNLDGIHGCGYMNILNPSSEIQHYEHLKNWSLSMLHHDIQLTQGNRDSETGLVHSLERFGLFHTLTNLIKAFGETSELTAVQYKCATQLLDWSQLNSTYKNKTELLPECFNKCYYFALKAFHDEDVATIQNEIQRAMKSVFNKFAHCSLESSKNLYFPLSELKCLKELEDFDQAIGKSNIDDLKDLFEKWHRQDTIKCSEFKLVEFILTNRTALIRGALNITEDCETEEYLQRMLCIAYYKLTTAARKEKKYETAIRTLSYFQNLDNVPKDLKEKMEIEKARVFWDRGDEEMGRFLLNHFLKKSDTESELQSKGLRIYGDWMAKTKSENCREIIENYYVKSIHRSTQNQSRIHSYYSLAKFADSIYAQLDEYLSSPLFEIKQNLFNTQQDLASELRQELGWNKNVEKKMAYMIASKQSAIDENEIKNCRAERDSYLTVAIKYYLLSLKEGEDHNLVIFRVISLWLSNPSNNDVIQQLQKLLHHIPTYKFLCLLPQLVPRMADVFLISDLIEKILQDHPHHTLPILFALSNSYEDLKYNGSRTTVSNPRVLAAKSILTKFETNYRLERLIFEMRRFSNALIELANYDPPSTNKPGTALRFADHLQIRHVSKLTTVSVPSLQIPFSKTCNYDNIIGVHDFEEIYYLVGGINVPKRVVCIGTDGIGRPLLVKGKDDLRQDAVMQQVFTIMNSLLHQNTETTKRKLVIRTYKVVPLSQRSGVIEWCENTQPLSLYLTGTDGKSGAHHRFYPNDTLPFDCRMIIRKAFADPHVTNEKKLEVFLDVCRQIHPVFHYFFIEKFPAAGVWFERRLAYTHSVATSSMIGYILGIGDRHVHNILIDNATAEVIHIDLGVAFEQGKTLPTPETVPFRLTRDIIDGMGLSGVEGDFRISCIKTMEVLRENQGTILTLLEVLLYDPLYAWTITPEKAYSIQNQGSSSATEKSSPDLETNKMAERALIRLKQKLQGTEVGFGATNVEGQVSYLVQQARDPNNLCRLFHGWQAYL